MAGGPAASGGVGSGGSTPSAVMALTCPGWTFVNRAKTRLTDTVRPELDADPRPGRPGRLRDGVLPGALTAAAHHQQVSMADVVAQRRSAAARRTQQQRARCAERHDGDHGVLAAASANLVAVPGDAVSPVSVQAQARG